MAKRQTDHRSLLLNMLTWQDKYLHHRQGNHQCSDHHRNLQIQVEHPHQDIPLLQGGRLHLPTLVFHPLTPRNKVLAMVDPQDIQAKAEVAITVDLPNPQEGIGHHTLDLEVISNRLREIMLNQRLIKVLRLHQHKLDQANPVVVLFLPVQFQCPPTKVDLRHHH